ERRARAADGRRTRAGGAGAGAPAGRQPLTLASWVRPHESRPTWTGSHFVLRVWLLRRYGHRLFPCARGGAPLDRVQHCLALEPVLERRCRVRPGRDAFEQVTHGMRVRMLPSDDVSARPPLACVRVDWLGDVD